MPQEVNTLETRNSAGGFTGAVSQFFTGIGNLVTSTAPLAADVYRLRLERDTLKNQSISDMSNLQAERDRLAASRDQLGGMAGMPAGFQPWMGWAGIGLLVLLLVGLVARRKR